MYIFKMFNTYTCTNLTLLLCVIKIEQNDFRSFRGRKM